MNPLQLSTLPSIRANDESGARQIEREGFVDEAVVLALINGPRHLRSTACHDDLALAADDLDFAGWQLPATPRTRAAEVPPQVIEAIVRRAAPPTLEEPGISAPHHGAHRWWLAGLAGVLSTMLFSLLLLTLSSRPQLTVESTQPAPPAKLNPTRTAAAVEVAPALTDASSARH